MTSDIDGVLSRLLFPEHLAAWTRDALGVWAGEQKCFAAERLTALEAELRAAQRHRERLTDLVVAGTLREDEFVRRRDDADARILTLRHALREPGAEIAEWRARIDEVLTAGCCIASVVADADAEARRGLLARVCSNLVVTNRITSATLRFPFTLLEPAADFSREVSRAGSNSLPSPETVLSKRKTTRRKNASERAALAWWTKVEEVRTQVAKLAA